MLRVRSTALQGSGETRDTSTPPPDPRFCIGRSRLCNGGGPAVYQRCAERDMPRFCKSRKAEVSKSRQPSNRSRFSSPNSRASFLAKRSLFKSTRADHFKSASGTRSGLAMAHGPARQRTLPANPTDTRHMAGVARHAGRVSERAGLLPLARSGASLRQTPTHPTRIDVTSIASRAAAGNRLFPARSRRIWLIY
jgi:hypothetical protein